MKPTLLPAWRVFAAFLIAPAFGALLLACLGPLWAGLPWVDRVARSAQYDALFYAYPATLLLGLPAFLILRRVVRVSLANCLMVGAAVAALPLLLLPALPNPTEAFSNGHVTVQNGVRTLDGWFDLGKLIGLIAIVGALAGVVFWAVAAAGTKRVDAMHGTDTTTPTP